MSGWRIIRTGCLRWSRRTLGAFLQEGAFDGLNVTIPYKKDVIPYCAELSDTARAIGAVNTLVRRADGTLWGDNTDAYGFSMLVQSSGADVAGKKALVFGSGGASATAQYVLRRLGAREVVVISRHGEDNYENLDRHADAQIAVNTTPVGMYPNTGVSPVDLQSVCRGWRPRWTWSTTPRARNFCCRRKRAGSGARTGF